MKNTKKSKQGPTKALIQLASTHWNPNFYNSHSEEVCITKLTPTDKKTYPPYGFNIFAAQNHLSFPH
jgi:hypothetical protein